MGKKIVLQLLCLSILFSIPVHSIVTLKNIVNEKDRAKYLSEADPVFEIFTEKNYSHDNELKKYFLFQEDAYRLKRSCKKYIGVRYIDDWSKVQVKRSILASLQFIGVEYTSKAIAEYSKYFEFTENEFDNLINGLVGNSCSQNITSISLKNIKSNLKKYFHNNHFELPNVSKDKRFPERLWKTGQESRAKKQEFAVTLDLFKAFCSWGNDVDNLRLMAPLVRDPGVMAFVIREMTGIKIQEKKNDVLFSKSKKTSSIICHNLICRKTDPEKILSKLRLSLGGKSFKNDFERLYCREFAKVDYKYKDQVPEVLKKIKKITLDEQNFLSSQFVSIVTGIPDFLIRSSHFEDLQNYLKAGFMRSWNDWSDKQINLYSKNLLFEERLILKVADRIHYFNEFSPHFSVELDINLGEFDSAISLNDKLKLSFELNISKKFLTWARRVWKEVDTRDEKEIQKLIRPFSIIIADQLKDVKNKFQIAPWQDGLERLISIEVMEQLSRYRGTFFKDTSGFVTIPVHFNYGLFALQHIHQKWLVAQEEGLRDKRMETLQELLPGR